MDNSCPCIEGNDDYDYTQLSFNKTRKAAKKWVCGECKEEINLGVYYNDSHGMDGNIWWKFRTCLGCADIRSVVYCGSYIYGDLWSDMEDQDLLTTDPIPKCIMDRLDENGVLKLKEQWWKLIKEETNA